MDEETTWQDELHEGYDDLVADYESWGDDLVLGLTFQYLKEGNELLDLGIGTGLSSINFTKAGIVVDGMDISARMLDQCRKKNFARRLEQGDLTKPPFPFDDEAYEHVLCCGVMHFFKDISPVFTEASRVLKPGGTFTFTIQEPPGNKGINHSVDEEFHADIWQHGVDIIDELLTTNGLARVKRIKAFGWIHDGEEGEMFWAYLAIKGKD